MKVGTLKKKLAKVPQDLPVWSFFPGEEEFVCEPVTAGIHHDYWESGECRLYLCHAPFYTPLTVAQFRQMIREEKAPNSYPVTDVTARHQFTTVEERNGKVVIS